jgi:hypothetical protein
MMHVQKNIKNIKQNCAVTAVTAQDSTVTAVTN